jgi:DNA-directed RNA polymerase subunit K/omega
MERRKKVYPSETIKTRDINTISAQTGNLYESVVVCSKRANQLQNELKKEIQDKLSVFANFSDSLEEIHENREQIDVSKYYEKLPKPTLVALEELLTDNIYFSTPQETPDDYVIKVNKK